MPQVAMSPVTDGAFASRSLRENIPTDPMLGPGLGRIMRLPKWLLSLFTFFTARMRPQNPLISRPCMGTFQTSRPRWCRQAKVRCYSMTPGVMCAKHKKQALPSTCKHGRIWFTSGKSSWAWFRKSTKRLIGLRSSLRLISDPCLFRESNGVTCDPDHGGNDAEIQKAILEREVSAKEKLRVADRSHATSGSDDSRDGAKGTGVHERDHRKSSASSHLNA